MKLTLVVPSFNEEDNVPIFYSAIKKVQIEIPYELEILFVDDGSNDSTLEKIKELTQKDNMVRYISFSRNFGKEAAIFAGLQNSNSELTAIMDIDLQDPPSLLPKMIEYIEQGYDSVATRRVSRAGEPPIRSFFARLFYRLINRITKLDIMDGARDYRILNRNMTDAVLSMTEYFRFSKGIFAWVGFKTKWIEYENVERVAGETKWSFRKLFLYALEGIMSFTTLPLLLSMYIGIIISAISFAYLGIIIMQTILTGIDVPGYASIMSVILFLGGVMFLVNGIQGMYTAKIYVETKKRPVYIISDSSYKSNISG